MKIKLIEIKLALITNMNAKLSSKIFSSAKTKNLILLKTKKQMNANCCHCEKQLFFIDLQSRLKLQQNNTVAFSSREKSEHYT